MFPTRVGGVWDAFECRTGASLILFGVTIEAVPHVQFSRAVSTPFPIQKGIQVGRLVPSDLLDALPEFGPSPLYPDRLHASNRRE